MKKFIVEGAITGTIYVSEEVYAKTQEQAFDIVTTNYDKQYPFEINFSELEVQEAKEEKLPMQLKVYFELHETDEEAKKIDDKFPTKRIGIWNENFTVFHNIFDNEDKNKTLEILKNKMIKSIQCSIWKMEK